MIDYADVTELAGDDVSEEQVLRVCTRYGWAREKCYGKDVLEIACGTGPGLGLIGSVARSLVAGDVSEVILKSARAQYGERIDVRVMDASSLPFADHSLDVVIVFEALYYFPAPELFIAECRRVLRPGGVVLVSNANKDLSDFNPSPYSHVYHGVIELDALFSAAGFNVEFWGDIPVSEVSWRQKLLRPVKKTVVTLGLMPKSMAGKKILKRMVFGTMRPFPAEITPEMLPKQSSLQPLMRGLSDKLHKVILCSATKLS